MSPRAPKICAQPGCPDTAQPGNSKCPQHARPPWRPGSTTRKTTLPNDWPKRRLIILDRDNYRCMCDGCPRCDRREWARCMRRASDVDHVGDRLDHSPANLRAICSPCHRHRSSSQGGTHRQQPR